MDNETALQRMEETVNAAAEEARKMLHVLNNVPLDDFNASCAAIHEEVLKDKAEIMDFARSKNIRLRPNWYDPENAYMVRMKDIYGFSIAIDDSEQLIVGYPAFPSKHALSIAMVCSFVGGYSLLRAKKTDKVIKIDSSIGMLSPILKQEYKNGHRDYHYNQAVSDFIDLLKEIGRNF